MLKAYQCDDADLYAAESAEQAAQLYSEHVGNDPEKDYPHQLTGAELDAEQPEFDENECQTGETTSVRQMLFEHGDEPGCLPPLGKSRHAPEPIAER